MSVNSDLLGWILERASGRPMADLLSERIWAPLGAELPAYITVDRLGAPRNAGGISASLRDLGRFGEMMRLDGKAGGKQEEYLKVTFTDLLVSSYQTGGSAHGDVVPTDQISLNYSKIEWEYKPQDEKGKVGAPEKAGFDQKTVKKV